MLGVSTILKRMVWYDSRVGEYHINYFAVVSGRRVVRVLWDCIFFGRIETDRVLFL